MKCYIKKSNKIIIKIIILTLILMLPLTAYMQGENVAYAVSDMLVMQYANQLIPAVGLNINSILNPNSVLSQSELERSIEHAKNSLVEYWKTANNITKFAIGFTLGNFSIADLNNLYGTSYSEKTVTDMGLYDIRDKINTQGQLTSYEMNLLGIPSFTMFSLRHEAGLNYSKRIEGTIFENSNGKFSTLNISGLSYWAKAFEPQEMMVYYFNVPVRGTQTIRYSSSYGGNIWAYGKYLFEGVNGRIYRIEYGHPTSTGIQYVTDSVPTRTTTPFENATKFLSYNTVYKGGTNLTLSYWNGSGWTNLNTTYIHQTSQNLINALYNDGSGIDLRATMLYGMTLDKIFPRTWTGSNILFGDFKGTYEQIIPESAIFDIPVDDVSTSAQAIIQAIDALGEDVQKLNVDLDTYINSQTGELEITATGEDIAVDTGIQAESPPDSSGDVGEGWLDIPILGTILSWLIKIWNMIKDIFDAITNYFNQSAESGGDSGTDWGNFKNFFDIFWIFYYLIIIAILLLVKFLAVVMNILSIPANTALFDSYPTMLEGINYVKGLKLGGFNVTIQQIFEYMFMVFFFIFIVTTIQKLYHVFTGVERQELRHNQRDIQIEKTSFSNEMKSNGFNNSMNGGNKK